MVNSDGSNTPERLTRRRHVLVFDSGMGGLTVAREIQALAPDLRVSYAADSGFFPYGDKPDDALKARIVSVAEALCASVQPDIFVIACNTASTLALADVRARLTVPVVGTVPAIKPAAEKTMTGVIGLLATPGTLRRPYTANLIATYASAVEVVAHGSVDLVHLAERQAAGEAMALAAFREAQAALYQAPRGGDIDHVVLACTHFPLVRGELAATVPHPVTFIDSGEAIARQTLRVSAQIEVGETGDASGEVWLTSPPDGHGRLVEVCRRFGFHRVHQLPKTAHLAS
ncbi:MAG: glutamate racemase [Pseudomonadota bacterium]